MAQITGDDDNQNAGSNSAPATSGSNVNLPTAEQQIGNGQRQQTKQPGSNPRLDSIRRGNPLSKFSSYTYSLTLYMLAPEALNYYIVNGKLPSNEEFRGGYIVVAQSGGINNRAQLRGPTFTGDVDTDGIGLDYYIDDLNFQTFFSGADGSKTPTLNTTFTFKVTEPIGFTFLTKLSNISKQLNEVSDLVKADKPNLYQQYYMIGVKFYGYDANGNMLDSGQVVESTQVLGDKFALFERLFPIQVQSVTFSINGRSSVYNWEAVLSHAGPAFGKKFGLIPNQLNVEGSTVGEILGSITSSNSKSLITRLNNVQLDRTKKDIQEKQIVFNIIWPKNYLFDSSKIFNSRMVTQEPNKDTSAMSPTNTTQAGNVSTAIKSNTINTQSKSINFPAGTPVASAIDLIVSRSSYVVDALTKQVNERIEAETKPDNSEGLLTWYTIKPISKILGRDSVRNDWVYEIAYEIAPYELPYIKNTYVTSRVKYYGPVKAYEYTLTGKNTEVINFEMTYNNLFYVQVPTTTTKDSSGKNTQAVFKATPRAGTSAVSSNTTGPNNNRASQIVDSVRANLYSSGDMTAVNIRIMGDPDYLMDSIGHQNVGNQLSKFLSENNSINPYGGQIFVEIMFGIAEDYKDNGLLDVGKRGESIAFYPFDAQSAIRNQGYIFKINNVTNIFSKGKFEQTLELNMVPVTDLYTAESQQQREASPAPAGQGRASALTSGNIRVQQAVKPEVIKPTKQNANDDSKPEPKPVRVGRAGQATTTGFTGAVSSITDTITGGVRELFTKPKVRPGQGGTSN